jgi:hypothetical protein
MTFTEMLINVFFYKYDSGKKELKKYLKSAVVPTCRGRDIQKCFRDTGIVSLRKWRTRRRPVPASRRLRPFPRQSTAPNPAGPTESSPSPARLNTRVSVKSYMSI